MAILAIFFSYNGYFSIFQSGHPVVLIIGIEIDACKAWHSSIETVFDLTYR